MNPRMLVDLELRSWFADARAGVVRAVLQMVGLHAACRADESLVHAVPLIAPATVTSPT